MPDDYDDYIGNDYDDDVDAYYGDGDDVDDDAEADEDASFLEDVADAAYEPENYHSYDDFDRE